MKVVVTLNGTDKNPYFSMGLKQNPFPQIPKAEMSAANQLLNNLDAIPIKDREDLQARLQGCSQEFIDLCLRSYRPGRRIRFVIEFPDPWS